MVLRRLLLLLGAACALADPAQALTPEQARAIASGDTDARISALTEAAARADAGLPPLLTALLDGAVKLTPTQVLIVQDSQTIDAATGAPATLPEDAEDVVNNNRMRGALEAAQAAAEVEALIVAEMQRLLAPPAPEIAERWVGAYPVAQAGTLVAEPLGARSRLVAVTGGTGMSMAFAIAEETIAELFG